LTVPQTPSLDPALYCATDKINLYEKKV